jgi:peptidyl-dipeptidase A
MPTEGEQRGFLDRVVPELARLEREGSLAYWEATTGGGEEAESRYAAIRAETARKLSDRRDYAFLAGADRTGDPLLDRQITLLRLGYQGYQADPKLLEDIVVREAELEGIFTRFRADLDGRAVSDNELRQVLERETDDGRRRRAWEASKQIGAEAAPKVRALAELRNRAARQAGGSDHFELALRLQELEPEPLLALLDDLERRTREPFRTQKAALDADLARRCGVAPQSIRPWHYADPFFQDAPPAGAIDVDELYAGQDGLALARRFYRGIGLDPEPILARSDVYERPGKQQHAYSIDIDRGGDVRILLNMAPGERWASTALHELGHATYDRGHDPTLPWLLRTPAHISTTEAVAMMMGRQTKDAAFLHEVAGLPAARAEAAAAALADHLRLGQLIFARWGLVIVRFERAMYADPSADLDTLWWDLVEDLQAVPRPEGRHAPDWAAKIHVATVPVYYQNYLLGELTASQLLAAVGPSVVGRPDVGAWLRSRVYAPGARWRWDELLERATGSPLSVEPYAAQFVSGGAQTHGGRRERHDAQPPCLDPE